MVKYVHLSDQRPLNKVFYVFKEYGTAVVVRMAFSRVEKTFSRRQGSADPAVEPSEALVAPGTDVLQCGCLSPGPDLGAD